MQHFAASEYSYSEFPAKVIVVVAVAFQHYTRSDGYYAFVCRSPSDVDGLGHLALYGGGIFAGSHGITFLIHKLYGKFFDSIVSVVCDIDQID